MEVFCTCFLLTKTKYAYNNDFIDKPIRIIHGNENKIAALISHCIIIHLQKVMWKIIENAGVNNIFNKISIH